jgi:hypothetical protein
VSPLEVKSQRDYINTVCRGSHEPIAVSITLGRGDFLFAVLYECKILLCLVYIFRAVRDLIIKKREGGDFIKQFDFASFLCLSLVPMDFH